MFTGSKDIKMTDNLQSNYRWYILGLTVVTGTFVSTIPFSCMPTLFKEISEDLGLSLVQIGTVWGMYPLGAIFATFIGGLLGDRFGAKRITGLGCILGGLATALRGLSSNFITLAITVLLSGLLMAIRLLLHYIEMEMMKSMS